MTIITFVLVGDWGGVWFWNREWKWLKWYYDVKTASYQFGEYDFAYYVEPRMLDPFTLLGEYPENSLYVYWKDDVDKIPWTHPPPNIHGWVFAPENLPLADGYRIQEFVGFTRFYPDYPFTVKHELRHMAARLNGCQYWPMIGHEKEFCR